MATTLERALGTRRAIAIAIALAMAVAATSSTIGFLIDDHAFRAMLHAHTAHAPAVYDLFRFASGSPAGNELRLSTGHLPWWSAPDLQIHFMRPLTSLAFAVDDWLSGDNPLGYHLHSLAWYLALLVAAAAMYRRSLPPAAATIAVAILGLSAAHVEAYAWPSARHVAIAGALSATALAFYAARRGRWLAPVALALALAASEAALAAVPLWIALVASDRTLPWRRRLLRCAVPVALAIAYLVVYRLLGFGTRGSGGYHDPVTDPLGFLALVAVRVPLLLGDAALGIPAELAHVVAEWRLAVVGAAAVAAVALAWWATSRLTTTPQAPNRSPASSDTATASDPNRSPASSDTATASEPNRSPASSDTTTSPAHGRSPASSDTATASEPNRSPASSDTATASEPNRPPASSDAVTSSEPNRLPASSDAATSSEPNRSPASSDAATTGPSPHGGLDGAPHTLGWLAAGGAAATVLGAAGFPAGRMLVVPDIAFAAVLGVIVQRGLVARWPGRIAAVVLAVVHLGIAPVAAVRSVHRLERRSRASHDIADEVVRLAPPSGRVFLLGASDPLVFLYPRGILADESPGVVRCWSVLSAARAGHRVTRTRDHAIEIEPIERTLLDGSFDTLFRAPDRPFAVGDSVVQCGARIRVLAVRDGRPARIEVAMRRSLDDAELRWLVWRDHRLQPLALPPVGQSVELPWSPGPAELR